MTPRDRPRPSAFHGVGTLLRFLVRLEWIGLTVWLAAIVALTVGVAAALPGLYPTALERQLLAETVRHPAMTALLGPGYGLNDYTPAAMMAHQMLLFTALAVATMNILFVVRRTRGDEEAGRIELIRSLPVGRWAPPAATAIVAIVTNVALTGLVAGGLTASGIESVDGPGSLAYGAALGATGMFFAAVALLSGQWLGTARGAAGWAFALLGGAYVLRAAGDVAATAGVGGAIGVGGAAGIGAAAGVNAAAGVGAEWLSLISPLGLVLRTQAFVRNEWWPVFALSAAAGVVTVAAFYVHGLRDLGGGLLPARPGPRHASRWLLHPLGRRYRDGAETGVETRRDVPNGIRLARAVPFGLAIRLQRGAFVAWAAGIFFLAASYGSVFGELETFLGTSDMIRRLLPAAAHVSLTEQFAAMVSVVMAMIGAIPAMTMVLRLKAEEDAGRTELLLTGAASRSSVIGGPIALSIVAAFVMPLLSGLGLGLAAGPVMDEPIPLGVFIGAALVHGPAVLVMAGVAAFFVGIAPRLAAGAWLYLGFSFVVVYFGPLLQLPAWTSRLSPFGYASQIPVESFRLTPVAALIAVGLGLLAAGVVGYLRRDVEG